MNNSKYISTIALGASLGLFAVNADAVSSADLTITGSVEQDCSVAINTTSFTVDLVAGEDDSTVATVTESCNDADGYDISFSSSNSGVLQNDDNANEQKAYSISYGTGAGSIDSQSLSADRTLTYSTYTANNPVPLRINLDAHGAGVLASGTWSDTITVSIAAK